MKSSALALLMAYRLALPGYHYEFPRDHFNHPEFQTEWWYYTGNLRAADGHRFGFELTFFRHGVSQDPAATVWDVNDAWLAHLALSDIDGQRFRHAERLNRQAAGLAGADLAEGRVWNGNWSARITPNAHELTAIDAAFRIHLTLTPQKPPVIHGANGVSQKAAGEGRASHYISITRLAAAGAITIEGRAYKVEGLAWMDHEFFTHQLAPDQTGWDWFSLQFEDNTELMLFRLRHKDGSSDPFSDGTYIDAEGRARRLTRDDFTLQPGATWTSPETQARYPVEWRIAVPSLGLDAQLRTRLRQQELAKYWEGAIELTGRKQGRPIRGSGYLEMTGYAGPVRIGD